VELQIVPFMPLKSSIMLLENIYSMGITNDDCHLQSSYFYSIGHRAMLFVSAFCKFKFTAQQTS
jgi:hypothetical protein